MFSDGFLKIYDYQGELNVIKDDYWGLKAKNIGDFKYNEQVVVESLINADRHMPEANANNFGFSFK